MRHYYRSPVGADYFGWRPPRTGIIRTLLITNLGIWMLATLTGSERLLFPIFGLVPDYFISRLMIWQPVTYMFLHAGFWHVAMNMFVLWMFGSELEERWGARYFLRYYLITGVGAGLITVLFSAGSTIPVVGASGAIYGVLLAYGTAFPDRQVYIYFMLPVRVKYFVGFLAVVAFMASIQSGSSTVSHLTHLSGMLIGWAFLRATGKSRQPRIRQQVDHMLEARRIAKEMEKDREEKILRGQVDQILDKINTHGYASLTKAEQDILRRAAVRFSRKNPKN